MFTILLRTLLCTVEPQYDETLYDQVLSMTNDFLYPSNQHIKKNLDIANKFCQSLSPLLYRGSMENSSHLVYKINSVWPPCFAPYKNVHRWKHHWSCEKRSFGRNWNRNWVCLSGLLPSPCKLSFWLFWCLFHLPSEAINSRNKNGHKRNCCCTMDGCKCFKGKWSLLFFNVYF